MVQRSGRPGALEERLPRRAPLYVKSLKRLWGERQGRSWPTTLDQTVAVSVLAALRRDKAALMGMPNVVGAEA